MIGNTIEESELAKLNFDFSKKEEQDKFNQLKNERPETIKEFVERAEGEAWREDLLNYGDKFYGDYRMMCPGFKEYFKEVRKSNEDFEKNERTKIENELTDRIEHLLKDKQDLEIIKTFKRQNIDLEKILQSQEKIEDKRKKICEIILKNRSFDKAVELQKQNPVLFKGFKDDIDFQNVEEYIKKSFSTMLLDKCLISEVKYYPNIVHIWINYYDFFLPIDTRHGKLKCHK